MAYVQPPHHGAGCPIMPPVCGFASVDVLPAVGVPLAANAMLLLTEAMIKDVSSLFDAPSVTAISNHAFAASQEGAGLGASLAGPHSVCVPTVVSVAPKSLLL